MHQQDIIEIHKGLQKAYIDNAVNSNLAYSPQFITNDYKRGVKILTHIENQLMHCDEFSISVAFINRSGFVELAETLKELERRGIRGRILTTDYLCFSEPYALDKLASLTNIQLKIYHVKDKNNGFHTKGYLFRENGIYRIIIGSANMTQTALSTNMEWNTQLVSTEQGEMAKSIVQEFERLWKDELSKSYDEFIEDYRKIYNRKKQIERLIREQHKIALQNDIVDYDTYNLKPNKMQEEFIGNIHDLRERGATRALLISATGTGKTYASAFALKNEKPKKALFIVHREIIAKQAIKSYQKVFGNTKKLALLSGSSKEYEADILFATMSMMAKQETLNRYKPGEFEWICIDEFHHAVNNPYRKITEYFEPKFLLGLTATPERMDGKDIYEICDYNVPYELPLADAINKGMLVPFHYYGIYDETDYSALHVVKGKYDSAELNETYIGNVRRHDLIYKYYCKYGSRRALGFCCTREHAEEMAKEFCKRGIPSVAVYSNANGEFSEDRDVAIDKLKRGDIRVIFSVDMFNEGVDVPSVDMVMFLRPTESPTIFLQQLGRGLRKSKGKEYLNVLDFIGNYLKAGRVRYLLTGKKLSGNGMYDPADHADYPDDCIIDFDMRLIDLFAEMDKRHLHIKDRIRNEYFRIKELLDKRPSRMDLFTYMDDEVYQMAIGHAADNPFKRYLDFLYDMNELTIEEETLHGGIGREFISLIENTNMSKVYKMPVLMAFYNHGNVRMPVTEEDLLISWKEFFNTGTNWKDLDKGITYHDFLAISDKEHVKKIMQMPVHFLLKSGNGFFVEKAGAALALRDDLQEIIADPAFVEHMKDAIEYRTMDYYQRRYRENMKNF